MFGKCNIISNLGAGDSFIITDFLSPELANDLFARVDKEIEWQSVHHRTGLIPRLMAIQGTIEDDIIPVYRHPIDEDEPKLSKWTENANTIKTATEVYLKQKINHALIQKYRNGQDNISEHSDKTLDITHHSYITNYSLGEERIMTLKNKTKQTDNVEYDKQKIILPHNSLFCMGLVTNKLFKHEIKKECSKECGERISFTFRNIDTFYDCVNKKLFGQGARKDKREVIDPKDEKIKLLIAFSEENKNPDFDWDKLYGCGFDCFFGKVNEKEKKSSDHC